MMGDWLKHKTEGFSTLVSGYKSCNEFLIKTLKDKGLGCLATSFIKGNDFRWR